LSQAVHRGTDAVLVLYDSVVRPKTLPNLFPRHYLTGMLKQPLQNPKRLVRQPNRLGTFPVQLSGAKIKTKV
jgi:hypothetical protein